MGKQSPVLRRLIDRLDGQGKQGKAGGRSGIHGGAAEQRKGKGVGGRGSADRWGRDVSGSREKGKRRAVQWAAAGGLGGPTGLAGLKGERLSFFSFLFQTRFKTTFLFKFKSNSFKLFLKNFINFL
jgi:hypothetical protein